MKKMILIITVMASIALIGTQALACYWDGYWSGPMGGPMATATTQEATIRALLTAQPISGRSLPLNRTSTKH